MTSNETAGSKPRLLAVDDNDLVLRVLEDHFSARGWIVWTAREGGEALDLLRRGMPDIVVSDVLMPGMDGWAFYEEFRRLPGSDDVPFIFLTVESDVPKRVRGLRLGADDYVSKPFDARELRARADRLLTRRATMAAARQPSSALLQGSVEHLAISDLLQILALNGSDGSVILRDEQVEGRIELERGRLVHAAVGRIRGIKALYRMMGWTRATFRVMERVRPLEERSIDVPATNALMDGLVALDEWKRIVPGLPSLDASVRLVAGARERIQASPITNAEYEVLTRARKGDSIRRIFDDAPIPDAEVGSALLSLIERGILEVSTGLHA